MKKMVRDSELRRERTEMMSKSLQNLRSRSKSKSISSQNFSIVSTQKNEEKFNFNDSKSFINDKRVSKEMSKTHQSMSQNTVNINLYNQNTQTLAGSIEKIDALIFQKKRDHLINNLCENSLNINKKLFGSNNQIQVTAPADLESTTTNNVNGQKYKALLVRQPSSELSVATQTVSYNVNRKIATDKVPITPTQSEKISSNLSVLVKRVVSPGQAPSPASLNIKPTRHSESSQKKLRSKAVSNIPTVNQIITITNPPNSSKQITSKHLDTEEIQMVRNKSKYQLPNSFVYVPKFFKPESIPTQAQLQPHHPDPHPAKPKPLSASRTPHQQQEDCSAGTLDQSTEDMKYRYTPYIPPPSDDNNLPGLTIPLPPLDLDNIDRLVKSPDESESVRFIQEEIEKLMAKKISPFK